MKGLAASKAYNNFNKRASFLNGNLLKPNLMKWLFCILFLSGFSRPALSQEEFIEQSRLLTRFDFVQLYGGVVLLRGQVDPFPDTLNFILDTGSGGISLDSTTVIEFGLAPVPSTRTIRGIAGIRNVSFIHDRQLNLPGLEVTDLDFHVNDYSILTSIYGLKIDGIIGYSFINRYILKLNYDSSKIEVWSKGVIKYPRGGFLLKPNINMLPIQAARIKDDLTINARFLHDMGAGLNMMLSTDFIRDSVLFHKKRKFYIKEAEGMGGKIDMKMTVIKEVKIGPYKFRNVPVFVFEDLYNITSYPQLSGLIGNDLLRRFNVIINYGQQEIHLVPNTHYYDPFDYSYTGIELYYEEGYIILGDVAKNSPAEIAGLKEGDVVVAINKNFTQNMQTYKAALQNTGDRVNIVVRREGELLVFDFKVKSIL